MPALGGVARRATMIDQERKSREFVLVLDAGDSLTGDQDPALRTQGQTSVDAMNRMGYDAMVLGPADLGLGLTALRQRFAEAKFAMVSANAVLTGTTQLVAQPYLLRELAGHRVAVVGLSGAGDTAEIGVLDPLATARKIVPEVHQQADVVILLSHAGPAVDQQIADEVPGVAAIVSGGAGGAMQAAWVSKTTGVPIYRADLAMSGHAGRVLGIGRLDFDASGKLKAQDWKAVSLAPEIADDPTMAAWVQEKRQP